MDKHVRTLYLLRLRDAIADKEWTIAQANRQLHACGDWSCDWGIPMALAQARADECMRELEEKSDGCRAIESAIAARKAPEWQPIETAPRDGTHILAINGKYGVRETFYRFYGEGSPAKAKHDADPSEPRGAWDWQEPQNHWASSWCPAYWMPLPAAPKVTP